MAKTSISLVSVQKPTSNASPVLQRRNRFSASIEQQIAKIGSFRNGGRVSREQFWVDGGSMFFPLPAQPVDATQALNLSAGVSNCKVSRGRSFS
jgi:hypothetical protein